MTSTTADRLHQLIARWRDRSDQASGCADELEALLAAPLHQPLWPYAPLPPQLQEKVEAWLKANRSDGSDVYHGVFPLGMVTTWIDRAERAEKKFAAPLPQPDEFLRRVLVDYIELRRWCQIAGDDENSPRLAHPEVSRTDVERWLTALPQPEGWQPAAQKFMIRTTPHLCPHCHKPTGGTTIMPMAGGHGALPPAPLVTDKE